MTEIDKPKRKDTRKYTPEMGRRKAAYRNKYNEENYYALHIRFRKDTDAAYVASLDYMFNDQGISKSVYIQELVKRDLESRWKYDKALRDVAKKAFDE